MIGQTKCTTRRSRIQEEYNGSNEYTSKTIYRVVRFLRSSGLFPGFKSNVHHMFGSSKWKNSPTLLQPNSTLLSAVTAQGAWEATSNRPSVTLEKFLNNFTRWKRFHLDMDWCATGTIHLKVALAFSQCAGLLFFFSFDLASLLRFNFSLLRSFPPFLSTSSSFLTAPDSTYATKVYPLTDSLREMQQNVGEMSASGGGDGPESVACALHEALQMDYRKNAARVVIIIADAPPHGIGERGDGFPNGTSCRRSANLFQDALVDMILYK